MVPTGTQVGPEIPTMAPKSADLGHLGAIAGRSWAVLGRSVGKVKMRGSFSGKNCLVMGFHYHRCPPGTQKRTKRMNRKRRQQLQHRPHLVIAPGARISVVYFVMLFKHDPCIMFLMLWVGLWEYAKHYMACELKT